MEDKDIQEDLAKLAPSLDKMKRQERQEIPDGYFENLQNKILAQSTGNQPIASKIKSIFNPIKLAAMIVLLVGLGVWIFDFSSAQDQEKALTDNEILAYIDGHISDFSELEIGNYLNDSELFFTIEISEEDILDEIDSDDFSMDFLEEQF